MSERLCRDVHPAQVTTDDGRVLGRAVSVFVSDSRIVIYERGEDRTVKRSHVLPMVDHGAIEAGRGSLNGGQLEARVTMPDGEQTRVWIAQEPGCGCGSPLKYLAADQVLEATAEVAA